MDAFVHASGDGFGNTAPLRSDTGAIDMDAISQVAHVTQGAGKLTRKEKKHAKREMKRRKKEAKKAEKEAKKTYSSIKSQLKDRDKELSDKMADARKKRDSAKDVVNYIGYNKMYQDGICEVEEGMFSSSIAFDDTSYHSVRDEQQKAMFSAITRLYDQFGADTLVQMSVINTPLLKEEVGHRKFFDPERQANDAARNDAQVFNNILNDKVKEGVSNIRRNRYLTYSVTADTAEDAARQLSRIEVESSRILNSIGSKAHLMNGTQRLSVIHSLLNPYKPFLFDYQRDISAKRLQTTKDCIAPTQIDFRPDGHYNDCVKLDNGVYAQVLVMKKFGSELSDRALADMADLPKSRAAFAAAAVFLAVAAILFGVLLHFYRDASPSPSPNGTPQETATESAGGRESEFPTVDWDYWKSVNGDVIGWITVPGTDINHPILQAHASDPDYYLHHDIYRNYNPLGALYLDAECEKEGFQSPNAVILGHSLTLGNAVTCFGNIQRYSDKSFASEHQTVLIQTPNTKMRYTVRFANIVKGWEPTKRTVFAGDSDFRNWYDSSRESAAMVLDTDSEPNQVISLVSCSYNFWKQNERTVVTTSIDQKQAQTETVSTESRQTGSDAE